MKKSERNLFLAIVAAVVLFWVLLICAVDVVMTRYYQAHHCHPNGQTITVQRCSQVGRSFYCYPSEEAQIVCDR